jgi:type II secretory pathway component PulC
MKAFVIYGVKPEQIFTLLNVKGEEDITIDHLVTLKGMLTALQEGETTPDQMFGQTENGIKQPRAKSEVKSAQNDTDKSKAAQTAEPLKDGLINVIKAKLEAAALSPQELFKHLKVQKFEDMNIGHLEEIFAWLKNPS